MLLLLALLCSGFYSGLASPVSKAYTYSDYSYNLPLAAYSSYSSYPAYNMFPYQGTVYPATYSSPNQQYQVLVIASLISNPV